MAENGSRTIKKRSGNYSVEEELLLATLINERKHIVECKKQGGTTWHEKQKAWREISNAFNSKHGKIFRDSKSLRNKWSQMKKKSKRKASENKKEILKTGGGISKIETFSDADNIIIEILGEQVDGLDAIYDSDAQANTATTLAAAEIVFNTEISENIIPLHERGQNILISNCDEASDTNLELTNKNYKGVDCVEEKEMENAACNESRAGPSQNWSHYSTKMLREQRHKKLQQKGRPVNAQKLAAKTVPKINEILAQTKLEFVLLQREKFLEEHNLRMQILQRQLEYENKRAQENNSNK